jgi:hypothetical protein
MVGAAEQNLKPATIERYGEAIEIYVKPNPCNTKLHTLDAIAVQDMYARMRRETLSPATVNLVHSVLSRRSSVQLNEACPTQHH